jgi:hypothetical protein
MELWSVLGFAWGQPLRENESSFLAGSGDGTVSLCSWPPGFEQIANRIDTRAFYSYKHGRILAFSGRRQGTAGQDTG